jgi:hypothetical protein
VLLILILWIFIAGIGSSLYDTSSFLGTLFFLSTVFFLSTLFFLSIELSAYGYRY